MNILITGATGFIGSNLIEKFKSHNITILTRDITKASNLFIKHDIKILNSLDSISNDTVLDIIINLAGSPISKRWTEKYKKTLIDSRVITSEKIATLVKRLIVKPKKIISA